MTLNRSERIKEVRIWNNRFSCDQRIFKKDLIYKERHTTHYVSESFAHFDWKELLIHQAWNCWIDMSYQKSETFDTIFEKIDDNSD